MKIADFVGFKIKFRSKEEVTRFLDVTGLQHPNVSNAGIAEYYSERNDLQIVERRYPCEPHVNPEFDVESQYHLYYQSGDRSIEASNIINQLTLPKPLDGVDILVLFLKKHRKLTEFKREFNSEYYEQLSDLLGAKLCGFLFNSFNWLHSERGFSYWHDLTKELIKMINALNLPTITHSDKTKFLKLVKYKSG